MLAGPEDELGASIVRQLLSRMSSPAAQRRGVSLLRNVIGNRIAGAVVKEFLVREVFLRIASTLGTPDAELRANLAASQVLGLMVTRYVLRLEPLASAPSTSSSIGSARLSNGTWSAMPRMRVARCGSNRWTLDSASQSANNS